MSLIYWQPFKELDIGQIKPHLTVRARNPGCRQGPCVIQIGVVDSVERNEYIKLTKEDSTDGRYHWLPIDWVEIVDEQVVYLHKPANEVMSELMDRLPG